MISIILLLKKIINFRLFIERYARTPPSSNQDGKIIPNKEDYLYALIGYQIRKARKQKGISQKKLSKITNIDQGDISKTENGLSQFNLSTILRLTNALDKHC